jgi:DNA-binding HxlR family transcriptional regulator
MLEQNGFLKRTVYDQTPVVIEYELTDYSQSLDKVLDSLREWGMMHRAKIKREGKLAAK